MKSQKEIILVHDTVLLLLHGYFQQSVTTSLVHWYSYLVHGHDVANIEVGGVIGTDGVPHEGGHLLAHRHAGPAGRDETGEKRQGLGKVAGAGNGTDTGAIMVTSTDASILTVAGMGQVKRNVHV